MAQVPYPNTTTTAEEAGGVADIVTATMEDAEDTAGDIAEETVEEEEEETVEEEEETVEEVEEETVAVVVEEEISHGS